MPDLLDQQEARQRVIQWADAMHPHLFQSFYENLEFPQDDDAVNDIDLQITTTDLEIEMLRTEMEGRQIIGDLTTDELHQRLYDTQDKKRKLLFAKRRHISSSNAYWYFMQ